MTFLCLRWRAWRWNKEVLASPSPSQPIREWQHAIVRWREDNAKECFFSWLCNTATMSHWVINHKYPGEFLGVMNDFPCHPQLIVNMTNFLLLPALQSFGHGPDFSCQIIEGASSCRSGIPWRLRNLLEIIFLRPKGFKAESWLPYFIIQQPKTKGQWSESCEPALCKRQSGKRCSQNIEPYPD